MHNFSQNDSSAIDESTNSINNRSFQGGQQKRQEKFVSNRQKIMNLHERIKMLDQIGNSLTGVNPTANPIVQSNLLNQQRVSPSHNSEFNNYANNMRNGNSIRQGAVTQQSALQTEPNQSEMFGLLEENLNRVKSEKTFLKRSLSPKPGQRQEEAFEMGSLNEQNFQRDEQQRPQEGMKFFRPNVQSPHGNHSGNFQTVQQQQKQQFQQSSNDRPATTTFPNNSSNHSHSHSASRLPYSPANRQPSPQPFTSQSQSISYYRQSPTPFTQDFFPLQARYLSIEDKFLQFKMSEENLLRNIEQEIQELQENCKFMKRDYEKAEKRNQETIDSIEKSLTAEVNELSAQLKQVKKGAIESLDTKHKAIRCQTLTMIASQFQSQCTLASSQIQTQLQSTQHLLQKEQTLRDQTAQFLINSFGDEIIKLEEVLNSQREARIRKNDELLRLINSVEDGLMDKIQKEKREMVENVEEMENMLEQVCYKIEEKILGH